VREIEGFGNCISLHRIDILSSLQIIGGMVSENASDLGSSSFMQDVV
jgi:hypothetical protein